MTWFWVPSEAVLMFWSVVAISIQTAPMNCSFADRPETGGVIQRYVTAKWALGILFGIAHNLIAVSAAWSSFVSIRTGLCVTHEAS